MNGQNRQNAGTQTPTGAKTLSSHWSTADSPNCLLPQVILFSWFLAGMIGVLCRMGGGHGLAEAISKFAKTRRSTLIVIYIMGWIIFFDDYTSSLLVGMTMRPISDKMRISREKLVGECAMSTFWGRRARGTRQGQGRRLT